MLDQKTIKGELFQNDGRFGNSASFPAQNGSVATREEFPFTKLTRV